MEMCVFAILQKGGPGEGDGEAESTGWDAIGSGIRRLKERAGRLPIRRFRVNDFWR
jgi:hypothetical protein